MKPVIPVIPVVKVKVVINLNQFLNRAESHFGVAVSWLKRKAEERGQRRLERERFELVSRLFGIEGRVGARPAGAHPDIGNRITPDTEEVLIYLAQLINSNKLKAQLGWPRVDSSDNLVCLGGPVANPITRQNMGIKLEGSEFRKVSNFPMDFSFSFELSHKEKMRRARRYRGGKICEEYCWPVTTPDGLLDPGIKKGGWLKDDYLLISYMPNLSDKDAWEKRSKLLIISGALGVGVRALELLFEDRKALQSVEKQVGKAPFYQSLLKVPEIEHNDKDHASKPKEIKHVSSIPLSIDEDKVNWWFERG